MTLSPQGVEFLLPGKVVLVTGGSSGIGRAIALASARAGADIVLSYAVNREGAEAVAADIRALGRGVEVVQADLSETGSATTLVERARARFGRVDVWINNAGADVLTRSGRDLSWTEKLDLLLEVDLRGTVLASWAAVEMMRNQPTGGAILNMAWDHVSGGMEGQYAEIFCAAKGGVYSFSRALARTVAPQIRVNVLGPGWVETAWGAELDGKTKQRIADSVPLRRWAAPEEIAAAAVFLACDDANYITGQMLTVNGGAVI